MAAIPERFYMYEDKIRYINKYMARLKGSKKKNKRKTKRKGQKELLRDMFDYMAKDFEDFMREKKLREDEALGIQRFPRGMDAEIEGRRQEKKNNRKKKKSNSKPHDGKTPRPAVNRTHLAEIGICIYNKIQ